MDQPGNSHFSLHMSQQTLNGHGGYNGRSFEANGHAYNGYADDMPHDYHTAAGLREAEADASVDNTTQTSADEIAGDATVPGEGLVDVDQAADGPAADGLAADGLAADGGRRPGDADGLAVDVAPDRPGEQDATGPADGEPTAGDASVSGTRAADRMRELLARSTVDHAATERATATALDGIRERLGGLERDVADRVAEQLALQAQRLAGMSATLDGLTASLSTFRAQISAIDGKLADTDSRLASADLKLASTEGRVTALDTRFERLDERLDDQYDRVSSIDGRVTSIDERVAAADGRIIALGGQFIDAITPLADELRSRPDRAQIEGVVTQIVEAAHTDLSTRLTSLEDTVLTLAEALLRPAPGHAPGAPNAPDAPGALDAGCRASLRHSHSIVPGGLLVTSRTTRLTSGTSLVMRVEIRASTSCGQPRPVGGHRVLAGHRAEHDRMAVRAPVTLHAYRAHVGQQHDRALPDLPVQPRRRQFLARDRVRLAQDGQPLRGDLADDADAQAGARERLPPDDLRRQAELLADSPHLVLEQRAQRLDQDELEVVRQPADIVMGLDVGGPGAPAGLNHVRVERSLHEELGRLAASSARVISRAARSNARMNSRPMILRLSSGSVTPRSAPRNASASLATTQLHPGRGDEVLLDLLRLALAQQPVVNEHAGQPVADGPLDEGRRHRGVDAARQPADGAAVADLLPDALGLLLDDVHHRPVRAAAGGLQEPAHDLRAVLGVHDLGVELDAVQPAEPGASIAAAGVAAVRAVTANPGGATVDVSPCDIQTLNSVGQPGEQPAARASHRHGGAAVLGGTGPLDGAAQGRDHHLVPVADAEHRDARVEQALWRGRGTGCVHRRRAAGQDDRLRPLGQHLADRHRGRHDL